MLPAPTCSGAAEWVAFYTPTAPASVAAPVPALASVEASPSLDDLSARLAAAGLDLVAPLRVSWYNDLIRSLGLATNEDHVGGQVFPFEESSLKWYLLNQGSAQSKCSESKVL